MYKSALDRMKRRVDAYGREIWVEKIGRDGKPLVYYKYDSTGRLMMHKRGLYGYIITPAEYVRFGEDVQIVMSYEL